MIHQAVSIEDIVEVRFLDHVQNADEPMACTAYGRVHNYDADSLTIDCWHPADPDHGRNLGDDTECFTIMATAIRHISRLKIKETYVDSWTAEEAAAAQEAENTNEVVEFRPPKEDGWGYDKSLWVRSRVDRRPECSDAEGTD